MPYHAAMANSIVGSEVAKVAQMLGSQSALARALVVAPSTVNQWVTGKRPVPDRCAVLMYELSKGLASGRALAPDFPWHMVKQIAKTSSAVKNKKEAAHG